MKDPRQKAISKDAAYCFPCGVNADFIEYQDFRDLCAEAGIAIDEDDVYCDYLNEFCDFFDYATVVEARQVGGDDGWLCIK